MLVKAVVAFSLNGLHFFASIYISFTNRKLFGVLMHEFKLRREKVLHQLENAINGENDSIMGVLFSQQFGFDSWGSASKQLDMNTLFFSKEKNDHYKKNSFTK